MKLLAHLKIKPKLLLMLFFPVLGLVYLATTTVVSKYQTTKEMGNLEYLVKMSVEVAVVLHNIQLERDLSDIFRQSQGHKFAQELKQQYVATDEHVNHGLKNIAVAENTDSAPLWNKVKSILQNIQMKRQVLSILMVSESELMEIYQAFTTELIQLIQEIISVSQHDEVVTSELAYVTFLSSKELATQERSVLFSLFSRNQFDHALFRKFVELVAQQQLYRRVIFTMLGTPEQQALWKQISSQSPFQEAQKMRDIAYAASSSGSLQHVDPDHWFQVQTQKINLLQEVENQLATDLFTQAHRIETHAYSSFLMAVAAVSMLLLLATGFVYVILKSLTSSLHQAVEIADAISLGNLNHSIEVVTQDETGQLLQSLAIMQAHLKERLENDKRIADDAIRLNHALDNVTTNILMTDNDYKIIYLNHAAQRLFIAAEEILRRHLPHFDAHHLVGTSIDTFHKNPSHQHRILESLTHTYHTTLNIGELAIDANITPVINPEGERLGAVVELTNRTLEVATEQEINAVTQAASQGNFSQRILLENKTGFFQIFSARVNTIMDLTESMIKGIVQMFSALAQGDLTQTIAQNYAGDFEQLKQDANATAQQLIQVMRVIQHTADVVNQAALEMSQGNTSLSQRTEEQASSLEEIAASMEQITSTIQRTADNAAQANELALTAKYSAEQGGEVVGATIRAITEVNHSSRRVTDIIGMINEIAFQTNLLALNAAVEAARAGEQGRGFAVVATEVRNLAQRSAAASKEIKHLIEESIIKVEEGTKLAYQSGETLSEIVTATALVSNIIADIANASKEQAIGIQYVNKALIQMDAMTQQNGTLVEQAASASQSLSVQVQRLRQQVAFFRLE